MQYIDIGISGIKTPKPSPSVQIGKEEKQVVFYTNNTINNYSTLHSKYIYEDINTFIIGVDATWAEGAKVH